MKYFRQGVLIRNIALVVITALLYPSIQQELVAVPADTLQTLLLFVGLIIVVPLFGWYEFSYRDFKLQSARHTWLSHLFIFPLGLAVLLLLSMIDILFVLLVGDIFLFRLVLLLIAFSTLVYDIWDSLKILK